MDSYRPPARDTSPPRGMVADREERYAVPMSGRAAPESSWERGRDQSEFDYGYGAGAGESGREDTTDRQRGKAPGEPSRDVIFLGLDSDLTENDVSWLLCWLRLS